MRGSPSSRSSGRGQRHPHRLPTSGTPPMQHSPTVLTAAPTPPVPAPVPVTAATASFESLGASLKRASPTSIGGWQERVLTSDLWLRQADVARQLGVGVRNEGRWEEWCGFVGPLLGAQVSQSLSTGSMGTSLSRSRDVEGGTSRLDGDSGSRGMASQSLGGPSLMSASAASLSLYQPPQLTSASVVHEGGAGRRSEARHSPT